MPATRFRNTAITFWQEPKFDLKPPLRYMIYQKELCPTTKREHWQAYAEWDDKVTPTFIRNFFGVKDLFIGERYEFATLEHNQNYCSKMRTKMGEYIEVGVPKGEKPVQQVRRPTLPVNIVPWSIEQAIINDHWDALVEMHMELTGKPPFIGPREQDEFDL